MEPRLKAVLAIPIITIAFYWKILSRQFSLLLGYEGANQAYAWLNFWVSTVRKGNLPIWDPYTFSGHAFAGEMQTGAFYPLNAFFLLFPFNRQGIFSPQLYHYFYILTHMLAAFLMFFLARKLGLSVYASLVTGLCFSLGGFEANLPAWPHLLGSAIWLPLIVFSLISAMQAAAPRTAIAWAALSGLGLSMAILAGGLHLVIMNALVAVSAVIYYTTAGHPLRSGTRAVWIRAVAIVSALFAFALAGAAIQLLPSIEYSGRALRFVSSGVLPATQKIPYAWMNDNVWPQTLVAFFVSGFTGSKGQGEYVSPYLGVFPLLLAFIGIWKNWSNPWVRYMSGLAVAAFVYALGFMTPLHGLLYAITPWLWMAREANRFLFLADFGLVVLAGFGLDSILSAANAGSWEPLKGGLWWIAIGAAVALFYPPVLGHGDMNPWVSLSLLLVIASYGLFRYLTGGHASRRSAQFLVLALIFLDLGAFNWGAENKITANAKGPDAMEQLLNSRGAVNFLRSRPGVFRVDEEVSPSPNIGDLFFVETTLGAAVTMVTDYSRVRVRPDLLNARYTLRPASAPQPGFVYADSSWKIYENPNAFPRAWLVHETAVERDSDRLFHELVDPNVNLHRTALLSEKLDSSLDPAGASVDESVTIERRSGGALDLTVHTRGRALLVLSELYYPGWYATLNGQSAHIWKVDGALRGVIVPPGQSRLLFSYTPVSFYMGAIISVAAFAIGAILIVGLARESRSLSLENPKTGSASFVRA